MKSQEKSIRQSSKVKNVGRSITLDENNDWLIVIPLDKNASCFHGKNTDWCTTKPFETHFEDYFYDNDITLIYFLNKPTGKKWAIAVSTSGDAELFDQNDRGINRKTFEQQTGIDPTTYINRIGSEIEIKDKLHTSREKYHRAIKKLDDLLEDRFIHGNWGKRDLEIEKLILFTKNKRMTRRYLKTINGPLDFPLDMQIQIVITLKNIFEHIKNPHKKALMLFIRKRKYNLAENDVENLISYIGKNQFDRGYQKALAKTMDGLRHLYNNDIEFNDDIILASLSDDDGNIFYSNVNYYLELVEKQKVNFPTSEIQKKIVEQEPYFYFRLMKLESKTGNELDLDLQLIALSRDEMEATLSIIVTGFEARLDAAEIKRLHPEIQEFFIYRMDRKVISDILTYVENLTLNTKLKAIEMYGVYGIIPLITNAKIHNTKLDTEILDIIDGLNVSEKNLVEEHADALNIDLS